MPGYTARTRRFFVFASLVAWLASPRLLASPLLDLELLAPVECPSQQAVVDGVASLVHEPRSTPLSAQVRVEQIAGRWRATLLTGGGERAVDGETCRAVVDAVVTILAMTLDRERAAAFEA